MMEDALPVVGALLELLRAVVVGGVLGGAFVAGCLRATLGALETILGALPPRPPQREIDGFRAALSSASPPTCPSRGCRTALSSSRSPSASSAPPPSGPAPARRRRPATAPRRGARSCSASPPPL